jgi:hypothetical protein
MKKLKEKLKKIEKRAYDFLFLEQETSNGEVIRALNYPHVGRAILGSSVLLFVLLLAICGVPTSLIADFLGFGKPFARAAEIKPVGQDNKASSTHRATPQNFELKIVESSNNQPTPDIERGAFIVARLMNKIVSENQATPVFAKVQKAAENDRGEVIPEGAIIIGNTRDTGSERRIYVEFTTAKFPDGKAHPFKGQLLSPDGSAGLAGEYTSGKGEKLGAAAISAFVAGTSAGLMTYSPGAFGGSTPEGNVRNGILGGLGNTANYATDLFTEDMRNSKGVISANPGLLLLVYMDGDFAISH